jgi:hypothetical protein
MPAPHHPPSSSPDQPPQWFLFGPWAFDFTAATAILRGKSREAVPLPVASWARAYGLDRAPGTGAAAIPLPGPGPGFDRGYAMTTDLTRPVIIATVRGSTPGERLTLLTAAPAGCIRRTSREPRSCPLGCSPRPRPSRSAPRAEAAPPAARRPGTGRSGR